jgi:hypothetical protein
MQASHSQAWQDLFVISMLAGARERTYLEIGANVPVLHNNTALLVREFGWHGVSIEFDPSVVKPWLSDRPDDSLVIADALSINYAEALPTWFGDGVERIDYLQLDIEPSFHTLQALKLLPLEDVRFSVITFETDAYASDFRARDESREILAARGYRLVAPDVCVLYAEASPDPIPFEDWWVDPEVVDPHVIRELESLAASPLMPQAVLFR